MSDCTLLLEGVTRCLFVPAGASPAQVCVSDAFVSAVMTSAEIREHAAVGQRAYPKPDGP